MSPFDYPSRTGRKHGPRGYATYGRFLPWIRDEFQFRCVYCLSREQWLIRLGAFAIDHFVPSALNPNGVTEYDNLLYACAACNLAKGAQLVPNPVSALAAGTVIVDAGGGIQGQTAEAMELIDLLGLNDSHYISYRRKWISISQLAERHDPDFYVELMRYPADLPHLARLRPPSGNTRPEGIEESYFARRAKGELPICY